MYAARYLMVFALLSAGLRAFAQDVPRYKLAVGQELRYDGTTDSKYERGAFHGENHWTAWVVRQNTDGGWHVVVQDESKFQQIINGTPVNGGGPMDLSLEWFDVKPDGHVASSESAAGPQPPPPFFAVLPATADQMRTGWESSDPSGMTKFATLPDKNTASEFVFTAAQHAPEDEIYLVTRNATDHFDLARGLISRVDSQHTQGYGFHSKGTGLVELKDVKQADEAFIKQLAKESEVYFEASSKYEGQQRAASADPNQTDSLMAEGLNVLHAAREKIQLPVLQKLLDQQISAHDRLTKYFKEEAERIAQVQNKPAADWKLEDLSGHPHSLADYRGKVVMLDFWYRGCGWCMKAMPQVKQVADDFKNQPVVVIGMNTDADPKDAQFVVDKMALNYQVLRTPNDLPEKYGVRGFPTFIMIDQKGIVREVHVGYSPHLRQEVGQKVKKLLAEGSGKGA